MPHSVSSSSVLPETGNGEEETTCLKCPSPLPLQLRRGYWSIAPSFLSLLFNLVRTRRPFRVLFHTRRSRSSPSVQGFIREFNSLCEGKHPAFDGENRTKQVFLDGTHGTPDMRISDLAIGIMHVPTAQAASEDKEQQCCTTSQLPHTLVIPAANRCYKGADEVFAGLIYQELEEHKAMCIIHEPMGLSCSAADGHQSVAVAADFNSSSTADISAGGTDMTNECTPPGVLALDSQDNLPCTTPLMILTDAQDLTRFHVCLSSPGIQTVVDGVSFLRTLEPIDILSHQCIKLKPIPWLENDGIEICSQHSLPTDESVCRKGRIECGIVAAHISPSQWDFLASSDCLVAAVAACEKKRLQLAAASHLCSNEPVTDDKITAFRKDYREFAEHKNEGGISERRDNFPGLTDILGSHKLPGSKEMLLPLPDIAYLMETVVPVLYPALETVVRDRPDDPLACLAFYLLRHSTGYSRTATYPPNSGAA